MTKQNAKADLFEEAGCSILDYNDDSAHQHFREEIWHEKAANAKSPFQYAASDKNGYTEPDHSVISRGVMEFLQPGTRRCAKGTQVHCVNDFLTCHCGLHRNRDDQWRKPLDARHDSAFEFIHFVTARPLRVHGNR